MRKLLLFIVLLYEISLSTQSNPLKDPHLCGNPTCTHESKFSYDPGTQFEYDYDVRISSLFTGTSKNESSIRISSRIHLEFTSKCEGTLIFDQLKLIGNDENVNEIDPDVPTPESRKFETAVKENVLRFSFQDGVITELCPEDDENVWVLNFKRGLLSMLQNSMKRFDLDHKTSETDVHGKCETKYTFSSHLRRDSSLIIHKRKDMNSCENRHTHHSVLQTVPYRTSANNTVSAMLDSKLHCEYHIDHHIYTSIECKESHMFHPLSDSHNGATTIVSQKLVLVTENNSGRTLHFTTVHRRTNLLYEQDKRTELSSSGLKTARELMKSMCRLGGNDMNTEPSNTFGRFVQISRSLSYIALNQLYSRSLIVCPTGRKHLLDVLPYLGSDASVHLMTELMIRKQIPKETTQEWLVALALIPRPTKEMLSSILELTESNSSDAHIALSVTSICRTFCKQNMNCHENLTIKRIIWLAEHRITESYRSRRSDRKTRELILGWMKAIGNLGLGSQPLQQTLMSIVKDTEVRPEVRVAAVEAFRRFPNEKLTKEFINILKDHKTDTQVRIASYLYLMQSPDHLVISMVKYVLETEEVNQVGSFIWSHLNNILKSSNPSRMEIQGLLSDKDLGRKFHTDIRKFSRNFERSVLFEELSAGGSYESNVIFSSNSYIPRSISFNVTLNLFSEAINLFEINTYLEGFEHSLERVFGPKGKFDPMKFFKKQPLRFPRSVNTTNALERYNRDVERFPNVLEDRTDEPRISFAIRIFGNDIRYVTFDGYTEIKQILDQLNPLNQFRKLFSGKEIFFDRAAMLMDASYTVPVGAGFPLTLNAHGTSAIKLKLYGSLRGADFMTTKQLDLLGSIHPRVAIDVIGSMSVNAEYASTGIKLKTSILSSAPVEGHIKLHVPTLFSLKFSLPNDRTDILLIRSDIVVMNGKEEQHQTGALSNPIQQVWCSWPAVDNTIGLKLCVEYQLPNIFDANQKSPSFLLSGPTKLHVSLKKQDLTAKIYLMEYKWEKTNKSSVINLVFDTPGSVVKRLLTANLTVDTESHNLNLFLETSQGTTLAKGKYKNTPDDKYIHIGLDINGQKHLDARVSINRTVSNNGFIYKPYIYLGVNDDRVAQLDGSIQTTSKKGILQCDVDLKFQTKRLSANLTGYISKSEASVATRMDMNYRFLSEKDQNITLECKFSDRSTLTITTYHSHLKFLSTAHPYYNIDGNLKLQAAAGHADATLHLNTGLELNRRDRTLVAQFVFMISDAESGKKINTYLEVKKPSNRLDWKLQFRFEQDGPQIDTFVTVKYATEKAITVSLYLNLPVTTLTNVEGRLNITIPGFVPLCLEGKIRETIINEYDVEVKVVWFSGHEIHARGRYLDKTSRIVTDHSLKLLLQSESFPEININAQYRRNDVQMTIEMKVTHSGGESSILLQHASNSPYEVNSIIEVHHIGKVYSLNCNFNLQEYRQIGLELHIDQWRDIHVGVRSLNQPEAKELGIELKWDANRDPDQKLLLYLDFRKPKVYHYNSKFEFSYPGRSVNGIFNLGFQSNESKAFGRLSWSHRDFIEASLGAEYDFQKGISVGMKSELLTSFEQWRKTSFKGRLQQFGNLARLNTSIHWPQGGYLSADIFGNYNMSTEKFSCEFTSSLQSTIQQIPSVETALKHVYITNKTITDIKLKYRPEKLITVHSEWESHKEKDFKQILGTIQLTSPFKGYNNGNLQSEFYIFRNRHVSGLVDLELDAKSYALVLQGHYTKLTNNTLVFNITTPVAKYEHITGRFGFSEADRHLIAQIKTPGNAVGVEFLFVINNITNYDITCSVSSPLEIMQNGLLIAKLNAEEADFQLGWNKLQAGLTAKWHFTNLTNFEYVYKIYTPIAMYEENGIVAKLILLEGLDTEFSIKFASSKLGISIMGKPKITYITSGLKRIGKQMDIGAIPYVVSNSSWTAAVELDLIIYETLKATVDFDKKGPTYYVKSALILPDGIVYIYDECTILEWTKITNKLQIETPYNICKEIDVNATLDVSNKESGLEGRIVLEGSYLNVTNLIEMGVWTWYAYHTEDELHRYNGTLKLNFPFDMIPSLDTKAGFEMDENICKLDFAFDSTKANILIVGTGEIDDGCIDVAVNYTVISPFVNLPKTQIHLKKDFNEVENTLSVFIQIEPKITKEKFIIKSLWQARSLQHFNVELLSKLPIQPLQNIDWRLYVDAVSETKKILGSFIFLDNSVVCTGSLNGNYVQIQFASHVLNKRFNADFNGHYNTINQQTALAGTLLYNNLTYNVNGNFDIHNKFPKKINMTLVPVTYGHDVNIRCDIQQTTTGIVVQSSVHQASSFINLDVKLIPLQKDLWIVAANLKTSSEMFVNINAKLIAPARNNISLLVNATTPFQNYEKCGIDLLYINTNTTGTATFNSRSSVTKSNLIVDWNWIIGHDMGITLRGTRQIGPIARNAFLNVFYTNPSLKNFKMGGLVKIDEKQWILGSNLTVLRESLNNFLVAADFQLPAPKPETYSVIASGTTINEYKDNKLKYMLKYTTHESGKLYSATANVNQTVRGFFMKTNITDANLEIKWGEAEAQSVNNYVHMEKFKEDFDVFYRLKTPKFPMMDTLKSRLIYKIKNIYKNISVNVYFPEVRKFGEANILFNKLSNMKGVFNISTPWKNMNHIGTKFDIETNDEQGHRKLESFWANGTAEINSNYKCKNDQGANSCTGKIMLEIPLTTRHRAEVDYEYTQEALHTNGHAIFSYNTKNIIFGKYKSDSEIGIGYNKDTMNIEIENEAYPIGITYIHHMEPKLTYFEDWKRLRIYKLINTTDFNITGDMHAFVSANGQNLTLTVNHANRTVTLQADYATENHSFLHNSKLQLTPAVWIAYRLNTTTDVTDDYESRNVQINLMYPRRNFSLFGKYNTTDTTLSSGASLLWNAEDEPRSVTAGLEWQKLNESYPHHKMELRFEHPSFSRNVSLKGEFESDDTRLGDVQVDLIYSNDPDKEFNLKAKLEREYNESDTHISYEVVSTHADTHLDLFSTGYVDYSFSKRYGYMYNNARYQRTFFPLEYGTIHGKVDLNENLIEYDKKTRAITNALYAKYIGMYPVYKADMFRSFGPETNQTGNFYMDIEDKLIKFDLNLTLEDSFHIFGEIPDAKRGSFNVWTDYDDLRIDDIICFLNLNHSRLVVSMFKWRPQLRDELQVGFHQMINDISGNISETFDYWKQYSRTELRDAIRDVWDNAEPYIDGLITDVKALRVIKDDADVFIQYLNASYHSNQFFFRDIGNFINSVIDEMAIRSHIESLPAVFSEIWDAMGESGKVIRESIGWIIETINKSIERVTFLINTLMQEDAMERLLAMSEKFLEKYDKFIKELHVSFIKSVENLWEKVYINTLNQWHNLLKSLEPGFIEFAHYVESLAYSGAKEFLDFLYSQTSDLVESPYFNRFTTFTADVDKFYRDLTSGDWVTIIFKYTKVGYNFIRDKYFSVVPFGRELTNVASEILMELQELKKLPSIKFLTDKIEEFRIKVHQVYDYLKINDRVKYIYNMIRTKINDVTETALQAENRYRIPKTKFVFDPNQGIILLEQKLPVSWHAFNQTPELGEIEEYAAISKLIGYFQSSNVTLWTVYHYWESFTDVTHYLPPFVKTAVIAGPQNLITFDGSTLEYRGDCSYLLAHDFDDGNFTVIVSYKKESYLLHLIVGREVMFSIDMHTNTITSNGRTLKLPYIYNDTHIYQEADLVTIDSDSGFTLRCHYVFDVCFFELSGWYFGKTSGLWGTMNNEPFDDLLSSNKHITSIKQLGIFAQSWSVGSSCPSLANRANHIDAQDSQMAETCEALFNSKISPLHGCFPQIDSDPYHDMCTNLKTEEDACSLSVAYAGACVAESAKVSIPDTCVSCLLGNGSKVSQGKQVHWDEKDKKVVADIVVMIEAKACNEKVVQKKNLEMLINSLEKEIGDFGVTSTRYAVVVFGGNGVYHNPKSVVSDNRFFVSAGEVMKYLDNIPTGNGTSDIFNAINYATRLTFRPGASKTFILLPCSDCSPLKMKNLDYAAAHQLLHERSITLHILMDEDFVYEKARLSKIFYGMDRQYAYTKKDAAALKGDKDLRSQARIPKNILGLCAPLALERNGTIFSSKKMEDDKGVNVKKFIGVFSKRMARSIATTSCQNCECSSDDEGNAYFDCFTCHENPSTAFGDSVFLEEDPIYDETSADDIYDSEEE